MMKKNSKEEKKLEKLLKKSQKNRLTWAKKLGKATCLLYLLNPALNTAVFRHTYMKIKKSLNGGDDSESLPNESM